MRCRLSLGIVTIVLVLVAGSAQTPLQTDPQPRSAAQTEQQGPIRVFTEEVVVPIAAFDGGTRFDPTLESQDILLLEDSVPQEIKSLRRIPASVLLLLDTSGELNPAMRTNVTRELAAQLVSQLRAADIVAAMQFGGRVVAIQDWTNDREVTLHQLKTSLSSGKGAHLSEVLFAAAISLRQVPMGSRHVVLITDGADSTGDKTRLAAAVRNLLAAQATIHIISFTTLGRKEINHRHPKYLATIRFDKRKSAKDIADEIVRPNDPETLETKLQRKLQLVIENDFRLWRLKRKYLKSLEENERWLSALAEESGGLILLPQSDREILKQADDVARSIDSQYILTYQPKRPLAAATADEYRRIEVVPRRIGLELRSRRGYVVSN